MSLVDCHWHVSYLHPSLCVPLLYPTYIPCPVFSFFLHSFFLQVACHGKRVGDDFDCNHNNSYRLEWEAAVAVRSCQIRQELHRKVCDAIHIICAGWMCWLDVLDVLVGCVGWMCWLDVLVGCVGWMWCVDVLDVLFGCAMRMWCVDVLCRCVMWMCWLDVVCGCDAWMCLLDLLFGCAG